jgi:hypothetical protein
MADVRVTKDLWDGLTAAQREEIERGLKKIGALSADMKIVGDAGVDNFTTQNLPTADGPCQAACTATYGNATRFCSTLPHPGARAACYAAAMAVYAVCLRNC